MKTYLLGQVVKVLWTCKIEAKSKREAIEKVIDEGVKAEWEETEHIHSYNPFIIKGSKYQNLVKVRE